MIRIRRRGRNLSDYSQGIAATGCAELGKNTASYLNLNVDTDFINVWGSYLESVNIGPGRMARPIARIQGTTSHIDQFSVQGASVGCLLLKNSKFGFLWLDPKMPLPFDLGNTCLHHDGLEAGPIALVLTGSTVRELYLGGHSLMEPPEASAERGAVTLPTRVDHVTTPAGFEGFGAWPFERRSRGGNDAVEFPIPRNTGWNCR